MFSRTRISKKLAYSDFSHFRFRFQACIFQIFFTNHFIMTLLFSANEQTFKSLKNLIRRVNEYVAFEDYVVMLPRIKKFKLDVKRKVWIICDRNDRLKNAKDKKRRHIISRCIKCLFFLIAKRMNDNDDFLLLKVINDQHNHEVTIVDFHSA